MDATKSFTEFVKEFIITSLPKHQGLKLFVGAIPMAICDHMVSKGKIEGINMTTMELMFHWRNECDKYVNDEITNHGSLINSPFLDTDFFLVEVLSQNIRKFMLKDLECLKTKKFTEDIVLTKEVIDDIISEVKNYKDEITIS